MKVFHEVADWPVPVVKGWLEPCWYYKLRQGSQHSVLWRVVGSLRRDHL